MRLANLPLQHHCCYYKEGGKETILQFYKETQTEERDLQDAAQRYLKKEPNLFPPDTRDSSNFKSRAYSENSLNIINYYIQGSNLQKLHSSYEKKNLMIEYQIVSGCMGSYTLWSLWENGLSH